VRTITATEASRNFKAVLDAVEHGETIVVTRGHKRIAVLNPAPAFPGRALKRLLADHPVDRAWEAEYAELRRAVVLDEPEEWPG
jgi:prevent-host-death family protein